MDDEEARKGVADYPDDDFISEDSKIVMQLAVDEHLLLSPTCIIAFLGKLLAHRYAAMGGYPRSLLTAKADRWNHIYLVGRMLDDKYAFRTMFYGFRDEVYAKSVENHMVNPRDFIVQQYPGVEEEADLALATDILRKIVVGELGLETDEEGCVNVPKKVERPLADRLYIILSNNGQSPISLKRLTEIINSEDGRKYVKATVSLALNKDPRFVNNGKKGLYALSEWQLPYFGSNVDIIYKVLSQYDRPMESDEILDVLNQGDIETLRSHSRSIWQANSDLAIMALPTGNTPRSRCARSATTSRSTWRRSAVLWRPTTGCHRPRTMPRKSAWPTGLQERERITIPSRTGPSRSARLSRKSSTSTNNSRTSPKIFPIIRK